ncbi:hypothetical protein BSNK01_04160 [Bacillaceae bacterium]
MIGRTIARSSSSVHRCRRGEKTLHNETNRGPAKREGEYGLTLPEVLAAVFLLSMVISVLFLVLNRENELWRELNEKEQAQEEARVILHELVKTVRNTAKGNVTEDREASSGGIALTFQTQDEKRKRFYWDNTEAEDPFPRYTFAVDNGDGNYFPLSERVTFFSWRYVPGVAKDEQDTAKGMKFDLVITAASGKEYAFSATVYFPGWE